MFFVQFNKCSINIRLLIGEDFCTLFDMTFWRVYILNFNVFVILYTIGLASSQYPIKSQFALTQILCWNLIIKILKMKAGFSLDRS
jgi:hypothetical protein